MVNSEFLKLIKDMPNDAEIEVIDLNEDMSAGTIQKVWFDGTNIIIEAGNN